MTTKRLSYICPIGSGLLTFGVLCVFALCAGKTTYELVTSYFWALAVTMIVASVVAWRTYADMKRLLAGKRYWRRPLIEGFVIGFLPGPITQGFGMIKEALASGPPWPSFGHSSLLEWLTYLSWFIPWWALFGAVGAAYAALLSGINRIALKVLADNSH
jgi:hypothetical protein